MAAAGRELVWFIWVYRMSHSQPDDVLVAGRCGKKRLPRDGAAR
jgi:hypothetical protein